MLALLVVVSKKTFSRLVRIVTGARADAQDEPLLETGVSKLEKFAHFWVLVWGSFVRNRCPVRASALSFSTLLALIPMLAVAMSVTSIFLKSEGEERIYQFVDKLVANVMPPAATTDSGETIAAGTGETNSPNSDSLNSTNSTAPLIPSDEERVAKPGEGRVVAAQKEAAKWIHDFIQNTRSKTLGVTGMVLLVFVAISMLTRIESTFNDIWGVTRGRNWFVRIIQYWATITLGPLLIIGALGLASGPHFATARSFISQMPFISSFVFQLLPLVVLWLTFALLYQLVPNTKVRFSAAMVGGIVAGSLWHLNNVFGFLYVSRVVTNSKIYGSLGLVPVFMAGIYLSWLILLFGAQMAYAFQNRAAYLQDKLAENVNQRGREFIALRLMTCIGQRFQRGLPPATIQEISGDLGVPSRLVQQVLQTLLAARLVVEVAGVEAAFAPARPLEKINCHHILVAMRATQGQELVTRDEPSRAEVYGEFARIQEAERVAASSVDMLALVNRAHARLEISPLPAREQTAANVLPPADPVPENEPAVELTSATIAAVSAQTKKTNEPTETDNNQSFPL